MSVPGTVYPETFFTVFVPLIFICAISISGNTLKRGIKSHNRGKPQAFSGGIPEEDPGAYPGVFTRGTRVKAWGPNRCDLAKFEKD